MKKLLSATLAIGLLMSAGGQTLAATGSEVVNTGSKYLGTPYQYGAPLGNTSSFDCSSYTAVVFAEAGVKLPRTSGAQFNTGTPVSKGNLQTGDLVFFKTTSAIVGHVGIYMGNGKMIGSQSSTGVATVSIDGPYWGERYVGARRVLEPTSSQATTVAQPTAPAPHESAPAVTAAPTGVDVHTVVRGNTLWGLSKKHGTSVTSIQSLNGLSSDMIYVGQKLKVPANAAPQASTKGSHTVESGDTLWGISKSNGTTVAKLMAANGLNSSLIHPGATLVIPQ